MSKYKLTYFNRPTKGRAEIVRLIFAQAGVEYEDVRLDAEAWKKLKPNTPSGTLPILEVDGVVICQSLSISRYLSKQFGLAGKTDLDQARVDMIVDCMIDATNPMLAFHYAKDDAAKAELHKKIQDELLPDSIAKLDKLLVSNNGGDGFFVGKEVTWADLFLTLVIQWPKEFLKIDEHLENYPKLTALCKRVESLPKIAEWIAKRPVTEG